MRGIFFITKSVFDIFYHMTFSPLLPHDIFDVSESAPRNFIQKFSNISSPIQKLFLTEFRTPLEKFPCEYETNPGGSDRASFKTQV